MMIRRPLQLQRPEAQPMFTASFAALQIETIWKFVLSRFRLEVSVEGDMAGCSRQAGSIQADAINDSCRLAEFFEPLNKTRTLLPLVLRFSPFEKVVQKAA